MNFTDVINTMKAVLSADPRFVDMDMSESSVFYNTIILPNAILAKNTFDINESIKNNLQITNYENLSKEEMDLLAENFFVTRRSSQNTVLEIKLYFNNPAIGGTVDLIQINTTDIFKTSSNQSFNPISNYIFTYSTLPIESFNGTNYRAATICRL